MAIKFQYNKTSLNELGKQLKVRTRALPTLKNKEAALRLEVKKAKRRSDELLEELASSLERYRYLSGLWNEFEPGLISVKDVELETANCRSNTIAEVGFVGRTLLNAFNALVLPQEDHPEGKPL